MTLITVIHTWGRYARKVKQNKRASKKQEDRLVAAGGAGQGVGGAEDGAERYKRQLQNKRGVGGHARRHGTVTKGNATALRIRKPLREQIIKVLLARKINRCK